MNSLSLYIVILTFILTLCSCATMFNSKRTSINIVTSEPSYLIIDRDTISSLVTGKFVMVDRDKKPINVTAFNDSLIKTIQIKPRNSFAYWLNLYPNWHLWTGFAIDTKTKKRYTYPKKVYIDLRDSINNYLTFIPPIEPYDNYSNIFKLAPLKLTGLITPSFELSYERKTSRSFSTQLMASYLFPASIRDLRTEFKPNIKGFGVSIEEKYYFRKSALMGPYLGSEFSYLKSQYKDIWMFGVNHSYLDTSNNFTNYRDTFGIKKQAFSFNLKLGYQLIKKGISLDFFAGLGLRYRDVVHFDRINPNDEMEMPRHPNVYYLTNVDGKYWTASIPLNFRIGWKF